MKKLIKTLLKIKHEEFIKEKKYMTDFIKLYKLETEIILLQQLLIATGEKV